LLQVWAPLSTERLASCLLMSLRRGWVGHGAAATGATAQYLEVPGLDARGVWLQDGEEGRERETGGLGMMYTQ